MLDVIVDGVITTNAHGAISDINPAAARMFMYEPSQIVGQDLTVLFPLADVNERDNDRGRSRETQKQELIRES